MEVASKCLKTVKEGKR